MNNTLSRKWIFSTYLPTYFCIFIQFYYNFILFLLDWPLPKLMIKFLFYYKNKKKRSSEKEAISFTVYLSFCYKFLRTLLC